MASKKTKIGPKAHLPFKTTNKLKRQGLHIRRKKALDSTRRDERIRRRREEDKDPSIREERLKQNVPLTLERKRVWDQLDRDSGDGLGVSVDVERLKRQKRAEDDEPTAQGREKEGEDETDSMINFVSNTDEESIPATSGVHSGKRTATERATSPVHSTESTNLDLTPESLALRFPSLFSAEIPATPKILITTSLNSSLHNEAHLLTSLFPFSQYIPRSSHHYGYKFSIREICSFASNRNYTSLIILKEDQKKPTGLTMVPLPKGPTFHFSVSSWVEGKKLPGHGRPTEHIPELILNNFRTPLGLLTAHLFRTLFPPQPDLQGRQTVTIHNQRDYVFIRRHRYRFRDKRTTEKSVIGADGKEVAGMEGIRVGLQELGPRLTLKLRRVDKGIQRGSGQEWEWRGGLEKIRTKFQL